MIARAVALSALAALLAAPVSAGGLADPVLEPRLGAALPSIGPPRIPPGYKNAFDDDRLNPHRGPRSARGDAQMTRVWDTGTVPMVGRE